MHKYEAVINRIKLEIDHTNEELIFLRDKLEKTKKAKEYNLLKNDLKKLKEKQKKTQDILKELFCEINTYIKGKNDKKEEVFIASVIPAPSVIPAKAGIHESAPISIGAIKSGMTHSFEKDASDDLNPLIKQKRKEDFHETVKFEAENQEKYLSALSSTAKHYSNA